MFAMTLIFLAGITAGIILTIFALMEFIRHESKRFRHRDEITDLPDDNTVSLASHRALRDSGRHRAASYPA